MTIRAAQEKATLGGQSIPPVPQEEKKIGPVEKVLEQYHMFGIRFTEQPNALYSGSPVLNARGQVAGMFIYGFTPDFQMSLWGALGVDVLKRPCP